MEKAEGHNNEKEGAAMKTIKIDKVIAFSLLLAISVASLSCGGGGGGGTPVTPPATGAINLNNAADVTYASIYSMKMPLYTGEYLASLLFSSYNNDPVTDYCKSGSYAFTPPVTDLAPGNTYTITFTNCVDATQNVPSTINGTASITIDTISGNAATGDFDLQLTVNNVNVSANSEIDNYASTISGGLLIKSTSQGGTVSLNATSIDNPNTLFTFSETQNGQTRKEVVGPFNVTETQTTGGIFGYGLAGDTATATVSFSGSPGIDITIAALQPINAQNADQPPTGGNFVSTASDDSNVSVLITNGSVDMAVDSNGDGKVEGHVTNPWSVFD